ncbi:MAG: methyltransferase [Polyangiaceae bacterium]|nr:methyltransferase [Polyangiaceae bacterium]
MLLSDLSKMELWPAANWRAFAKMLREAGLTPPRVSPIVEKTAGVHPALRRPIRRHHLRALSSPAGVLMRLFMFSEKVTAEEANEALGEWLPRVQSIGLLRTETEGEISCPFVLSLFNNLLLFSDELSHGGDAVIGFGEGTIELCRAALPTKPIESALDLGCGSGTAALLLSFAAKRVVATDINPRALSLARINAAMNSIANVEFRLGSLFEPVQGEKFDVIASQPPFVPMPEGVHNATFLYGGSRGDELALTVFSKVAEHLTPKGRAVFRVDWPLYGEIALEDRLFQTIGSASDLVLVSAPTVSNEDHASAYASGAHPLLDDAFDREAEQRIEHLERHHINGIVPSIVAVQKSDSKQGTALRLPTVPFSKAPVESVHIDQLFAGIACNRNDRVLLSSTLRVPEKTILAQEQVGPGAEVESSLWARFADNALGQPVQLTPDLLFLITCIHEALDVRSGLESFAEQSEIALDHAVNQALPAVRHAVKTGLLHVVVA